MISLSKINIIIEYDNGISKNNKIIGTTNQPSKFRTRNWVEINDESRGAYKEETNNNINNNDGNNNNIKLKTSMIRSGLFDYTDT